MDNRVQLPKQWTEDGPWSSDTVTNLYNTARLRSGLILAQATGTWTNGFGYDAAHRLTNVTSTAGAFSYAYTGVGSLVQKLSLPNTSYITNVYDSVARLTSTKLNNSGNTTLNKHEYLYNTGNQRIRHTRTDDSYYTNLYDNIGQLLTADSTVASEDRFYGYDAGWNLAKRTNNTTVYTFGVNVKNELTNGPTATYGYDNNGNLTSRSSGYVTCTYDAENQLVSWQNYQTAKTDFVYDGRGRLKKRLEYTWMGSPYNQWSSATETRYVYDGMRVIQERTGGNVPAVAYTRGSDLSGSMEGAGGIGGLLARSHQYSSGSLTNNNYYHADGGNVTYMVDTNQANVATYRYDPYGNQISSSGSLASANLYRFSSKEMHVASAMYYYGYRFYDPNLQRWPNRDPIGEKGGINLYAFVHSNPLTEIDPKGYTVYACTRPTDKSFPAYGMGRHAHLWDDRVGVPWDKSSCGEESQWNVGPTHGPRDAGPVAGYPPSWDYLKAIGVECNAVPGSAGHEDEIMQYCRDTINDQGMWKPINNDCHTALDRVLGDLGYESPPHRALDESDAITVSQILLFLNSWRLH